MLLPLLLLVACDPLPVVQPLSPPPEAAAPTPAPEAPEAEEEPAGDHNRAPAILGIDVQPMSPKTEDDVVATVETADAEDDYVRVELYWSINGEELPAMLDTTLRHDRFRKGDELRLRVEATDRKHTVEGHSSTIVVRNTPPEITNKAGSLRKVEGYRITAEDVDEDPLTFRLQGEPAGMTIDEQGVLHYRGSEDEQGGDYKVEVLVEDGSGGVARWGFGLSVQPGSKASAETQAAAAESNAAAEAWAERRRYHPPEEKSEDELGE